MFNYNETGYNTSFIYIYIYIYIYDIFAMFKKTFA